MQSAGVSLLKLEDGTEVKINPYYYGKISEDKKEEAFAWLRDNNFGDLIKNNVSLDFGMAQEITVFENCPKLKELLNIIEEGEGKFIIWASYVHNIESIIDKLKKNYGADSVVSIYGEIAPEQRQEAVTRFQEDDKCRFFVGNPSTGGYGLTLTKASYVIYFNNSYNLEIREQSEDRAHRIGQTKNVLYIDLVAEKTIDELIIAALKNKIKISAQTLGEVINKWL